MRLRTAVLIALAGAALAGCGATRTIVGDTSPQVAADITVNHAAGIVPPKAETQLTIDVITARLQSLGVKNYSLSAGDTIKLSIDGSVDVHKVQLAAQTPGVLLFTAIGPAASGQPPATDPPEAYIQFDTDSVVAVSGGAGPNGSSTLDLQLNDTAAHALNVFTAAHIGDQLVVQLDHSSQALKTSQITAPFDPSLMLEITVPPGMPPDVLTAILLNGPFTPGWR